MSGNELIDQNIANSFFRYFYKKKRSDFLGTKFLIIIIKYFIFQKNFSSISVEKVVLDNFFFY